MRTGKQALIEQFLKDGIHYMFGNPGTVEQGFLNEINNYKDLHYITCLQETIAVAMADGYARKTKKPALVQLHSGVGLGNGIGMLYQAYRGHSPLIVIAGEAGIKYSTMDAQMACDLVQMAKPVTKYADRVVHKDSLLRLVRRAIKIAMTPPMGPVFLCLPMDVLEEENTEEIIQTTVVNTNATPDPVLMETVAKHLLGAKHPLILVGDGVNNDDAEIEAERTAVSIGASVWGINSSCINFNQFSPFYRGDLGHMFGSNSEKVVKEADVILVLGTYLFPEVFPSLKSPFNDNTIIIHIDQDSYEIAKNHMVTYGVQANIKSSLICLNSFLAQNKDSCYEKIVGDRFLHAMAQSTDSQNINRETMKKNPVAYDFFKQLKAKVNENGSNLILFDEALTAGGYLTEFLPQEKSGTFFQTRGGSLGVGIPGAIGIKLAQPDAQVIGFTGDGGSMYTIQALYTAMRYHIPAKFVVCNNGSYQLLKDNMNVYWRDEDITESHYPDCFSLSPAVDFVKIAASMGVKAVRVNCQEDVLPAVEQLISLNEPFLIDLKISKE